MEKKNLSIEHKIDMKLIAQKEELSRLKNDKRLEERVRKVTSMRVLIVATFTMSKREINKGYEFGTTTSHSSFIL